MVEQRPWPITGSLAAGLLTIGGVFIIYINRRATISLGLLRIGLIAYQWWRDIRREATLQGHHREVVERGIRWGMVLFIISEVIFFFSFFWAYFHSRLSPTLELGIVWPPVLIYSFNPFRVPLLNTTILLTSGLSVTWAHHRLLTGDLTRAIQSLILTILLGVYFRVVQGYEYIEARFSLADSCYGRCFFVATGFHGLHVLIGTLFLLIRWLRLIKGELSRTHHFGLEAAAWYWHFVDVVWIFLFISIYWWGS